MGGVLTRRHVPTVYDFIVRISLNPETAVDSTEAAIERALDNIRDMPSTLSFSAWLLGIARDEALEGMRPRSRGDGPETSSSAGSLPPTDALFTKASGLSEENQTMSQWAWQAARGQRPRDYSILDLLLRQKLSPEEIAEIASLSRSGVSSVLGRLRGNFEDSFAASALYHTGRQGCKDLDALIEAASAPGPALRREIARHAEDCSACRKFREGLPSAADLFASLDQIEVPADAVERLMPPSPLAEPESRTEEAMATEAELIEEIAPGIELAAEVTAAEALTEEEIEFERPVDDETESEDGTSEAAGLAATAGLSVMEGDFENTEAEDLSDVDSTSVNVAQPSLLPEEDEDLLDEEPEAFEEDEEEAAATPVASDAGEDDADMPEDGDEDEGEEPEEEDETEQGGREYAPLTAPLGRGGASRSFPRRDEDVEAGSAGAGVPPGGPLWAGDEMDDDGGDGGGTSLSKYLLYGAVGVVTLIAIYVGIAVGSSIKGGGSSSNNSNAVATLPTRVSGVTEAACSPGPVTMQPGSRVILVFNDAPSGYTIDAHPGVSAVSNEAAIDTVTATSQEGNTVLFAAEANSAAAGRTDEYSVTAAFTNGGNRRTLECVVQVKGAGGSPTATVTPKADTPTPAPTETATPTEVPVVAPVQPLPTATPVLPTETPSATPTETPAVAVGTLLTVPSPSVTPTIEVTGTPSP